MDEQQAPTAEEVAESVFEEELAETEVEETEEQTEETEQVEEESETTAPEEKTVPLKAVQEERRKRQELERELAQLREQAITPIKADAPADRPKAENFDDYDNYVEALADWKIEQREQSRAVQNRAAIEQREFQRLEQKAIAEGKKTAEKYEDFYDVVGTVKLPTVTLNALYQSDIGAEIIYHLGKNEAELDRLMDMPPARQIMELGKLETRLAAKTADPRKKEVRTATEVETAGRGFKPGPTNITKLKEDAQRTGVWTKYLEAIGEL